MKLPRWRRPTCVDADGRRAPGKVVFPHQPVPALARITPEKRRSQLRCGRAYLTVGDKASKWPRLPVRRGLRVAIPSLWQE
jgi:hypothetical protein